MADSPDPKSSSKSYIVLEPRPICGLNCAQMCVVLFLDITLTGRLGQSHSYCSPILVFEVKNNVFCTGSYFACMIHYSCMTCFGCRGSEAGGQWAVYL